MSDPVTTMPMMRNCPVHGMHDGECPQCAASRRIVEEYSPGFTITTKQDRPEIWHTMAELRWLAQPSRPGSWRTWTYPRLQQFHREDWTGRTEWRDVPVVTEP